MDGLGRMFCIGAPRDLKSAPRLNVPGHILATGHILARGFPDAKDGSTHLILVRKYNIYCLPSPMPIILLLHDSSNCLAIAIYPGILGVEISTLRYLRVLRVGILAVNDAASFCSNLHKARVDDDLLCKLRCPFRLVNSLRRCSSRYP